MQLLLRAASSAPSQGAASRSATTAAAATVAAVFSKGRGLARFHYLVRFVVLVLRVRRQWARQGAVLNTISGLTEHVERIRGELRYRQRDLNKNYRQKLKPHRR
jgi:hypothetical protein